MIPGWPYSFVTATQLRDVVDRLIAAEQWKTVASLPLPTVTMAAAL